MAELGFESATALAGALRRREIASRELLDHLLARGERHNPALGAIVTLDEQRAADDAAAADEAAARGEFRGPLHGLPMTVKDSFETAGMRTTSGAPELSGHVPQADADAVARLRSAGAVIFGKTNLPLYAMDIQSYNAVFGTTNNPWDLTRAPGGSSGGAAAALAAGLTAFEIGSDIGGSIRNPAHFCGVFGLKTSYGIVPMRGHIPGPPGTLADADIGVAGPMGRAADDLDLGLDVLAGPDESTAVAWRLDLPRPRADALTDYRVGIWLDDPHCPVDGEVGAVLQAAVDALRAEGGRIDDRTRPVPLADSDRVYRQLLQGALANGYPQALYDQLCAEAASTPPADDEPVRLRTARDVTQRKRDWNVAHERRLRLGARWAEYFRDHDVLLCPVTPTAAIRHDHSRPLDDRTITVDGRARPYWEQLTWAGLAGVCYLPSAVLPVGRTRSGLPVGMQVIAGRFADRTAVDVARRIAAVVGGFRPPPGY